MTSGYLPRLVHQRIPTTPETTKPPTRMTPGAACFDFFLPRDVTIPARDMVTVGCGFLIKIPWGFKGTLSTRSSWQKRKVLAFGKIDCDYRGELHFNLYNLSDEPVTALAGERMVQMDLDEAHLEIEAEEGIVEVDTLRGDTPFGSTGK